MGDDCLQPIDKATKIAEILYSKKAEEIKVLGIGDLTLIADYFVICVGTSTTHVKALADIVGEKLAETGEKPLRVEGFQSAGWVLIDYGSVVVHIFTKEMHDFYNLERLWGDAEEINIDFKAGE